MSTANATQEVDSQDSQSQEGTQNSQDHSATTKEGNEFDARSAFNSTNEKVNKLSSKLENFDPELITKIATQLGISKEEAKEEVKEGSDDVKAIVNDALWDNSNSDRVGEANKDGHYDKYIEQGLSKDYALRLAEQDQGITVDTSDKSRQAKAPATASVDRDVSTTKPESLKGLTQEEYEKFKPLADQVQIVR